MYLRYTRWTKYKYIYHPKTSNENYAGRDLPTPNMKEEKDTVSVDKHKYIIVEQINTEADEHTDNAVVIEVSESRFVVDYYIVFG